MEDRIFHVVENLLEVGRGEEAVKQCVKYLSSNPECTQGRRYLVRAHLALEEYDKAEQAAMALIKLAPEDAFPYYLRSLACENLKQFNSSFSMAKTAVQIDPENEYYLHQLAECELQQGMLKKAKVTAQTLVTVAPNSENAHELLGRICLETEDYKLAEKHYREALRFDPNASSTLNNLALSLSGQNKTPEAIDVLFNALKLKPHDETLKSNTFLFVKKHLDKSLLKGKRKAALNALPVPIQMFYRDYKQRTSIFDRYSSYMMGAFWIGFLFVTVAVLNLFVGD